MGIIILVLLSSSQTNGEKVRFSVIFEGGDDVDDDDVGLITVDANVRKSWVPSLAATRYCCVGLTW